ncbi:helix-turn-helix domain-containing protein [Tissierella creatinophila]|uniref:HTH-type transcriptional regulator PuuR n=1 Tax=Tissierella creatinophila DSM 6911 TaxID=1123403 RepID=A0A1U7M6F5_TISCR|nr:helix-turn-helix transcriptional regulator [Tissierella creatinophila]OLS02914.1 HTH-type transcriptional regulator PuuR [Tissierella creatinophila DSM 6911]
MEISKNVKKLRKEQKLTLRELAVISGLTFSAIAQIERDDIKDPHISTVIKLARAFNISIDELIG